MLSALFKVFHRVKCEIGVQKMFGNKRRTAIKQRAKLMGRMVMLLTDGLCSKSYDQFVERYSNPGDEPDESARNARISRFQMRFSASCWYEATASLPENAQTFDFYRGRWRRLRCFHKCARAGRCQRAFLSRSRFACAAGCETGPRCRRNGARGTGHTRLARGRRNLNSSIEAKVHDVAVLHDVVLALEPHLAGVACAHLAATSDIFVI